MNRRRADIAIGVLIGFVLLVGGTFSWLAYRRRRAIEESMGPMMDSSIEMMHGPDPFWYVAGTILVAVVIGGIYILVRGDLTDSEKADSVDHVEPNRTSERMTTSSEDEGSEVKPSYSRSDPQARILDLLPDDEKRVLEPVLNSPGITQIELRDRSKFSKSKVSQTASSLEERGLLYRERQGRTYRIYPSDELLQQQSKK